MSCHVPIMIISESDAATPLLFQLQSHRGLQDIKSIYICNNKVSLDILIIESKIEIPFKVLLYFDDPELNPVRCKIVAVELSGTSRHPKKMFLTAPNRLLNQIDQSSLFCSRTNISYDTQFLSCP